MMKIKQEEQVTIKVKGDKKNLLKEIVKKISESKNAIGFSKSPFTDDERRLIDELNKNLNG